MILYTQMTERTSAPKLHSVSTSETIGNTRCYQSRIRTYEMTDKRKV
jgi:hypothetical protein